MKRFIYRAKVKEDGKSVKGNIQAENERAAGQLLIQQGYIPDSIIEEGTDNPLAKAVNRVTSKDRIVFTRQFATLIGAGLPLSASLRTIADQTQGKAMKAVVEEILADVEAGRTLNESIKKFPEIFNKVYTSLIEAGEMSGTLDIALKRLADQEEKDEATMGKIKGALVYPAILFVVIVAVVTFMLIEVVPQVQDLYESMGEDLPVLSKFLIGIKNFVVEGWWFLLMMVGGLVFSAIFFARTSFGRATIDTMKLRVPLFGKLFQKLYVSRFARTAEMMLQTGVAMIDSVQIASAATSNTVVEKEFLKAVEYLKSGKPLSEALEGREFMLPLVPQMASIGEQSGKIDEMLAKAAQTYENELDAQIDNISTLIEPIMLVIMAGMVGLVLAGTILPIYQLVNKIN